MEKKKLFIIANQHMDLVWRRCFERDFQFGGQNFVPYADLEELYIKDSITLCEKYPFYHFCVECVAVLDKFLQRNPQMEEKIKQLERDLDAEVEFKRGYQAEAEQLKKELTAANSALAAERGSNQLYTTENAQLKDKLNKIKEIVGG